MRHGNPAVKGLLVVAVLVDGVTLHLHQHVARLDARQGCRATGDSVGDVRPTTGRGQLGVVAQLRVARRRVLHPGAGEALVRPVGAVLEEVGDHGGGQHIHALRTRVVAHQDAGEFAVLDDWRREASLLVLEREGQAVDEERRAL